MRKETNKIAILALVILSLACKDDSLDPFRLNDLQKGSLLAIRNDDGEPESAAIDANFFLRDNITGDETFSYVADFISEDQTILESVQVYARLEFGSGSAANRTLVATVPGSQFVAPAGKTTRQGRVSVTLAEIMSKMGNNRPDTISKTNLLIESDIVFTNGSIAPSSAFVNAGLTAADFFFPAHKLIYFAEKSSDFQPVATSKLAGEVVKDANGKVTARPVFPLKVGARDTVMFTFAQPVLTAPGINYSPASAVTTITPVTLLAGSKATYFQVIEATGVNTTAVTATASGSTRSVLGSTLTMKPKNQTINVDNTIPQLASLATGDRLGKGQLATIKAKFNEKMSAKSANRIKITVSGQGQEGVSAQNMTLSSDGLEVSYVYLFKELSSGSATHGPLTVTFTGGADEAGNPLPAGVLDAAAASVKLISDIGTPPAPSLTLDGGYDLGTQIKWSADQNTGVDNIDGSTTGRVYWVAVTAGSGAPANFALDADENGVWTLGSGTSATTSVQAFSASIPVSGGTSGSVFSPLTANGSLDIYAVFVSNTGNKSSITVTPQLSGVVMNP